MMTLTLTLTLTLTWAGNGNSTLGFRVWGAFVMCGSFGSVVFFFFFFLGVILFGNGYAASHNWFMLGSVYDVRSEWE